MQVIFSTLSRQLNKFSEHETFHRISRTVKNIILQLSLAWKLTRSTDCKKEQAYYYFVAAVFRKCFSFKFKYIVVMVMIMIMVLSYCRYKLD